ncbi:DUF3325 domain-containing protein [Moritella sp. 28]|uniref:DUF3325 domain-containing protein n=1 Tax=Moritella sp. 28 TaxID=2746232 RepID=UPI001BABBB68|nr:DUF3325 domain-containing protein [Moritella sp. 28]QUM84073.1 DUF3325 domain-containing protein [Moritella sp. 28]
MFFILTIGFFLIAISTKRHHAQVFSRRKVTNKESRLLKTAGFSSLTASAFLYVDDLGITYGIVFWTGMLTVALFTVCLFLTYKNNT